MHRDGWPDARVEFPVTPVAPGLFMINSGGLAAASLVRSRSGQDPSWETVYGLDESGSVIPKPIVFGPEDETPSLILYVTGVRGVGAKGVSPCGD